MNRLIDITENIVFTQLSLTGGKLYVNKISVAAKRSPMSDVGTISDDFIRT